MNPHATSSIRAQLLRFVAGAALASAPGLRAQETSQTLKLNEGWNAVPLRVAPAASVGELMAGQPVDLVTAWYPERSKVASLQDPAAEAWKDTEWRTWQAPGLPGAALNNLHALESGRAYLIKARAPCEVTIPGAAAYDRLRWIPQSFNLTGLPADPAAPATLASFFAHSPAHQPLKAFRLVEGKWRSVPADSAILPDTAYWIWCGEGSEYQGPLDLRAGATATLTGPLDTVSAGLLSTSGAELPVRITASGGLPLAGLARDAAAGTAPRLLTPASDFPFRASPVVPDVCRISLARGAAAPADGAFSVLEFRAAGVRLTLPVRYRTTVSVP